MRGHTRKSITRIFNSENFDAVVYSSGGVMFTVSVTHYLDDDGSIESWLKSFHGVNAKDRAFEYASGVCQ